MNDSLACTYSTSHKCLLPYIHVPTQLIDKAAGLGSRSPVPVYMYYIWRVLTPTLGGQRVELVLPVLDGDWWN